MTEIQKINVATTASAQQAGEVKGAKTQEVQTAEAKALEAAKINENANVAVDIAEEAPQQEEKQGFFSKLWSGAKSFFAGEGFGKASKMFGGVALGGALGTLFLGPVGMVAGMFLGGLGGSGILAKSASNGAKDAIAEKAAESEVSKEELEDIKDVETASAEEVPKEQLTSIKDVKAGTTEETTDADGNKIVTKYDENGEATVTKYDPEGNEIA